MNLKETKHPRKYCTGDGSCGSTHCPHYVCTGDGKCGQTVCAHTPLKPGDWRMSMTHERALTGKCYEIGCCRYRKPGEMGCSDHPWPNERNSCWYRWCVMPTGNNRFCFDHACDGAALLREEAASGKLS